MSLVLKQALAEAIESIEVYWHKRQRDDLLSARDAFAKVATEDSYLELLRIRNGLVVLALVDDYARTVAESEIATAAGDDISALTQTRQEKLFAVYTEMKNHRMYQGFTTAGMWESRSVILLLRPHIELWATYINHKEYYE